MRCTAPDDSARLRELLCGHDVRADMGVRYCACMSKKERSWVGPSLSAETRDALSFDLSPSQLWSLLLDVMEKRASDRATGDLREQWLKDRFVQPCAVDQRALHEIDGHLLAAAAAFEAVELSPVAPLGVCSSVGLASQNKIVSTVRGTEVVSDPTNVLALECARRLQENSAAHVRLTTNHRCLRAQEIPNKPGFAAHFRMFCLVSAGHERGNRKFTSDALIEHINTHLSALKRLAEHGYAIGEQKVRLLSTAANVQLADRIAAAVSAAHSVSVQRQDLDHPYYDGIRFMIDVRAPNGLQIPLIDGGAFDWLRKLASNRKRVFVASGMGSQVVAVVFGKGR